MFIDARSLPSDSSLDYDICIVGGGAAGITLALELMKNGTNLCVLESGGLYYEDDTQLLAFGSVSGDGYPDLDVGRLRILGGSTNHWAGNCTPLDSNDFEKRSWVPYSGWPFSRKTLDPYYRRAHRYLQLGPYNYESEFWATRTQSGLLTHDTSDITTGITGTH